MIILQNDSLSIELNAEFDFLIIKLQGDEIAYSIKMLNNLLEIKSVIQEAAKLHNIKAIVSYSLNKNVWSYGGDLGYFYECISTSDSRNLKEYAYKCVEMVYQNNCGYETNIPTCSIVNGKAYGGGFESALSSNIVMANANSKFSFPEINFGSFPGMGAFSILTKKMGIFAAKSFIENFKIFDAQELENLNIIDKSLVYEKIEETFPLIEAKIDSHNKNKFISNYLRLSLDELKTGTDFWVDKMMNLDEYNRNKISRINTLQNKSITFVQ